MSYRSDRLRDVRALVLGRRVLFPRASRPDESTVPMYWRIAVGRGVG